MTGPGGSEEDEMIDDGDPSTWRWTEDQRRKFVDIVFWLGVGFGVVLVMLVVSILGLIGLIG